MAKYNLETQYSVVGLVEHFNTSISVMEQYLPGNYPSHVLILWYQLELQNSFRGQQQKQRTHPRKLTETLIQPQAIKPCINMLVSLNSSFSVFFFRDILKRRLHLDVDFYEFAKQRLFMQWNRIIHHQSDESWEKKFKIVWKVSFVILFSVVTFIFSSDACVHKHPRHPLDFPVYTSQNIGFTTRKCYKPYKI